MASMTQESLDRAVHDEVNREFHAMVDERPSKTRWVLRDGMPKRQSEYGERYKERYAHYQISRVDNEWQLDKGGACYTIILVDDVVQRFLEEWARHPDIQRTSYVSRKHFRAWSKAFEGVRTSDTDFLVTKLSEVLGKRRSTEHALSTPFSSPGLITIPPSPYISQQSTIARGTKVQSLHTIFHTYDALGLDTYQADLINGAIHLLDRSRPPRVWTMPDSPLGIGDAEFQDAEVLLLTESEAHMVMAQGLSVTPIVIREPAGDCDVAWRPRRTAALFEDALLKGSGSVSYQWYGDKEDNSRVNKLPLSDFAMRTEEQWDGEPNKFPINLLSLPTFDSNLEPPSISKNATCGLLRSAVTLLGGGSPEKQVREYDIGGSLAFDLYAQRGAISMWHKDTPAGGTWVRLSPQRDGLALEDDAIKCWAIINDPTQDELAEFARDGDDWRPSRQSIPVIYLLRGDTLVMQAGGWNIHAVITISKSHMTGGMYYESRRIMTILDHLLYIYQSNKTTNEQPPEQTSEMLDNVLKRIEVACHKGNAKEYGLGEGDLERVFTKVREIVKHSKYCRCSRKCGKRCPCHILDKICDSAKCGCSCH